MACALASQIKTPREMKAGPKAENFGDNFGAVFKYIEMSTSKSGLECKRCVPAGYKCTLGPGEDGAGKDVDAHTYIVDKSLDTGLFPGMIDGVARLMSGVSLDKALMNSVNKSQICKKYDVKINSNEDGSEKTVKCIMTDDTIVALEEDDLAGFTSGSKKSAQAVRNSLSTDGFTRLNPASVDDDFSIKLYHGLLGVGAVILLYKLSEKYNALPNFKR